MRLKTLYHTGLGDIEHQPDFCAVTDGFNASLDAFAGQEHPYHILEWFSTLCRELILAAYERQNLCKKIRENDAWGENEETIGLITQFLTHYLSEPGHPSDPHRVFQVLIEDDSDANDPLLHAKLFLSVLTGSMLLPIQPTWKIKCQRTSGGSSSLTTPLMIFFAICNSEIGHISQENGKTEKAIRAMICNTSQFKATHAPNLRNAIIHDCSLKAKEAEGLQEDIKDGTVEAAASAMSEEEKKHLIDQLIEHRELERQGVRGTNKAAATDGRQMASRVRDALLDLFEHTGIRAFALFSRGNPNNAALPHSVESNNTSTFFQQVLGISPLDLLRCFEQWSCTQDEEMKEKNDINSKIKKDRTAAMSYVNYNIDIHEGKKIELAGWPVDVPMGRPSKFLVETAQRIRDMLRTGAIKWVLMTKTQHADLVKEHTTLHATTHGGSLRQRAERSDKGKKCGPRKGSKKSKKSKKAVVEEEEEEEEEGHEDDEEEVPAPTPAATAAGSAFNNAFGHGDVFASTPASIIPAPMPITTAAGSAYNDTFSHGNEFASTPALTSPTSTPATAASSSAVGGLVLVFAATNADMSHASRTDVSCPQKRKASAADEGVPAIKKARKERSDKGKKRGETVRPSDENMRPSDDQPTKMPRKKSATPVPSTSRSQCRGHCAAHEAVRVGSVSKDDSDSGDDPSDDGMEEDSAPELEGDDDDDGIDGSDNEDIDLFDDEGFLDIYNYLVIFSRFGDVETCDTRHDTPARLRTTQHGDSATTSHPVHLSQYSVAHKSGTTSAARDAYRDRSHLELFRAERGPCPDQCRATLATRHRAGWLPTRHPVRQLSNFHIPPCPRPCMATHRGAPWEWRRRRVKMMRGRDWMWGGERHVVEGAGGRWAGGTGMRALDALTRGRTMDRERRRGEQRTAGVLCAWEDGSARGNGEWGRAEQVKAGVWDASGKGRGGKGGTEGGMQECSKGRGRAQAGSGRRQEKQKSRTRLT
ncbi:hypothetical protein B0H10DRAFT_1965806 [Mycena sp. CBHHK59/15]|nr:hypothetical protein B0H10DRAFT_1965806 [Mycena sp. CBHHK59/15]